MRVLHITSGNLYGGVEVFLATLVREASAAPGMEPDVAVCFEGRFSAELQDLGHPARVLPSPRLSRPQTVLNARRALRDLLQRESYDVVVCHQPWACVMFAPVIRRAGFPVVLWVHMAGDGTHWLERLCRLSRPDFAICNSRYTAARTSTWLANTQVEHVYCALSAAPPVLSTHRSLLRDELETSASDLAIVQVSRLEPWKGHAVLLSALAALRDVRGWTLWFVGGPQAAAQKRYLRDLQSLAVSHGIERRVRFLGERRDVHAILAAADIFCQPNTSPEPFGLSLVEAQRAGLPIVTSAIGGALEVVDESCGVLTDPGDAGALSSALESLVLDRDLRTRLATGARQRADQLCNAPRQIRRIEAVLATTLSRPKSMSSPVEAGLK